MARLGANLERLSFQLLIFIACGIVLEGSGLFESSKNVGFPKFLMVFGIVVSSLLIVFGPHFGSLLAPLGSHFGGPGVSLGSPCLPIEALGLPRGALEPPSGALGVLLGRLLAAPQIFKKLCFSFGF